MTKTTPSHNPLVHPRPARRISTRCHLNRQGVWTNDLEEGVYESLGAGDTIARLQVVLVDEKGQPTPEGTTMTEDER